MPELTLEQQDELADQSLRLKMAAGDFIDRFFDILTPEQRDGLRTLRRELGDEVDHLTAVAIQLTLANLQTSLGHLKQVTTGVTEAVVHLNDVRKVITIATSLIDLGAAIASANPGAVLSALKNTVTAVEA